MIKTLKVGDIINVSYGGHFKVVKVTRRRVYIKFCYVETDREFDKWLDKATGNMFYHNANSKSDPAYLSPKVTLLARIKP